MAEQFDLLSLMPADTPAYMAPAWIGALSWALGQDECFAAFQQETGNAWKPPRSGLDAMIDEASGYTGETVKAFVRWFNVNVWGPVGAGGTDAA